MSTHEIPTTDELLHAWIDNELASEHEQRFYSLLASDNEYRSRLRQLQTIRMHALRYAAQSPPPAAVSDSLFGRLGLETKKRRRHTPVILSLLTSSWAPVASAAVAAFLTAVILLGIQQSAVTGIDMQLAENIETTASTERNAAAPGHMSRVTDQHTAAVHSTHPDRTQAPSSHSTTLPASNAALMSSASNEQADRGSDGAAVSATFPDNAIQTADAEGMPMHDARTQETGNEGLNAFRTSGHIADSQGLRDIADLPASETRQTVHAQQSIGATTETRIQYPAPDGPLFGGPVTVELRGVTATSFPVATVPASPAPWMENMAVAVFYTDAQVDYGLEYGQEAFSQHFDGIENKKYVRYEQNLRTSWIIGTVRHRLAPIQSLAGIEPYASIGAGATAEIWPLLKGGIGLMYMPDQRVRFHVGLEGALLAYPWQQRWFTSRRVGVTYGLSVLL